MEDGTQPCLGDGLNIVDTFPVAAKLDTAQVRPLIERSCRRPRGELLDFAGGDRGNHLGLIFLPLCD